MTRGNQRDVDRARAQARAAKHKKASKDENKARAKTQIASAEIMRQKGLLAAKKKQEEMKKKEIEEEKKKYIKFVRRMLSEFYRREAPEKLENLPKIMEKFEGKWDKLMKGLEKAYGEKAPNLTWEQFQVKKNKLNL
eukprot:CAMPEP_0185251176 /NCGR_PEP_ID=MMETSP1359-20130426/626_1 /TAXON_ID=552665 /ORGANISM="Bigelowiella longifila, Strain CCMP242" /LENGTH=136 /DNA_ID=CAMNT_0027832963 /DNA_START=61 /DNA_END=471 /DNA_ORIENTATION=+